MCVQLVLLAWRKALALDSRIWLHALRGVVRKQDTSLLHSLYRTLLNFCATVAFI